MIEAYPDGTVRLNHAGGNSFRTRSGGILVRSTGNTDTEDRMVEFTQGNGTVRGRVGYSASNNLDLRNMIHGGLTRLQAEDAGGATQNILTGDPDGSTVLYEDGGIRLETVDLGIDVRGSATNTSRIRILDSGGTARALLGNEASDELRISNLVNGAAVAIRAETTGGATRTMVFLNPDGAATFLHPGGNVNRLATSASGKLNVLSDGNTDSEDRYIALTHQDQTERGILGFVGNDDLIIRNAIHSGLTALQGEDSGGAVTNLLVGDPNGDVELYYDGIEVFRTADEDASDNITGAEVRHANDSFYSVGLAVLPPVTVNAARTIGADDWHRALIHTEGTARAWTFNSAADVPNGAVLWIINTGGNITLTQGSGVTIRRFGGSGGDATGNFALGDGGFVTVYKRSDTEYYVTGAQTPL